jgi:hypothetical protein
MVQFSNGGGASIAGKGISNKNEQSAIAGSIAVSVDPGCVDGWVWIQCVWTGGCGSSVCGSTYDPCNQASNLCLIQAMTPSP